MPQQTVLTEQKIFGVENYQKKSFAQKFKFECKKRVENFSDEKSENHKVASFIELLLSLKPGEKFFGKKRSV